MALPLRCAASLRLAGKWALNLWRSLTVTNRSKTVNIKGGVTVSQRLTAHRSGKAIRRVASLRIVV
jgi:hypothetical protein